MYLSNFISPIFHATHTAWDLQYFHQMKKKSNLHFVGKVVKVYLQGVGRIWSSRTDHLQCKHMLVTKDPAEMTDPQRVPVSLSVF